MSHVRPCAHTAPPRLIAGYVGPASGLRTALLTGAALGRRTRAATGTPLSADGGAR